MIIKLKKLFNREITNRQISYDIVRKMMKNNPDTILLDIRSKQEYNEGHLPGSIFLNLYDIEKKAHNIISDKTQIIITYCTSGIRSRKAQRILERMGYENVYNLKGGLDNIDIY